MARYIFQQSRLPSFGGPFGQKIAKTLWDLKLHYADCRQENDDFVAESDSAYLCERYVPDTGAALLIEDGEFGESDVHDITNLISIRLSLACMPRGATWLTVSSRENDTNEVIECIQDLQMSLHRKSRSRRQVQRFFKQGIVRGSTYLWYDWDDEIIYRRVTNDESAKALGEFLAANGMSQKDAKRFSVGKVKDVRYSGPIVTPLDYYDVWIDPYCDVINDRRPANIIQRFRPLEKLKKEVDENEKSMYSNLKDIEPYPIEELYGNEDFLGGRKGSLRLFGEPSFTNSSKLKLVPTYTFYLPYFELDGYQFWDSYFTIALSRKGQKQHLIKIEENNELGLNHLIIDHYTDWFTQSPYGLSGVQFQLSKYHQKNFIQLLTVTAMAHSILPPQLVLENAIRNEEELNYGAGGTIGVMENPLGLDVIKPLQGPNMGAMNGEQYLRFYADEMKASMGADGFSTDSGSRTLTKPKTATEINRDVSSGSFFLDNAAENLTDTLNQFVQGVYELSTVRLIPNDGMIEFDRYQDGKVKQAYLSLDDLQVKRSIQVTGVNGQLNKQQDVQNLLLYFQTLGQIPDPAIIPLRVYVAQEIAEKASLKIPAEFKQPPEQLVAQNPQVQMAAIQQALQNPQMVQAVVQAVMQMVQQQGAININGESASQPEASPSELGSAA